MRKCYIGVHCQGIRVLEDGCVAAVAWSLGEVHLQLWSLMRGKMEQHFTGLIAELLRLTYEEGLGGTCLCLLEYPLVRQNITKT